MPNRANYLNDICFSDEQTKVEKVFKDYIYHYMSEVEMREGYSYDNRHTLAEKDQAVNKLMKDEVAKLSGINFENSRIPVESLVGNPNVQWAFYATTNALIDMVLPDIIIRDTGLYTDTRVLAYGDTARFDVKSNDRFYVSKAGRAMRTTEFQREYASTITINPENHMISVSVDQYKIFCGIDSMAAYTVKVILAVEEEINREVYTTFDTAMATLPTTPADSALQITGWDETEAVRLAQTVQSWNGNSRAIFMGTPLALRKIMPKDANYRYALDSDYVRLGYIRDFMGFGVMVMPQVADWRNPYKLALNDDKIYVFSPALQKPVHLVLEGATRTNAIDHFENADLTASNTLYKAWGIGVGYNGIAGLINLA